MNIAALATQKGLDQTSAQRYLITTDAQVASGIRTEDTIESERRQADRTLNNPSLSPAVSIC